MDDLPGPLPLIEFAEEVPGHLVGAVTTADGSRLFGCGESDGPGCRCVDEAWRTLQQHPAAQVACSLVSLPVAALLAVDPAVSDRSALVHRMADVALRRWTGDEVPIRHDLALRTDGHLRVVTVTINHDHHFASVDPPALCTAAVTGGATDPGATVCQLCAGELLSGPVVDAASTLRVAVGTRTLAVAGDVDGRIGLVAALAAVRTG